MGCRTCYTRCGTQSFFVSEISVNHLEWQREKIFLLPACISGLKNLETKFLFFLKDTECVGICHNGPRKPIQVGAPLGGPRGGGVEKRAPLPDSSLCSSLQPISSKHCLDPLSHIFSSNSLLPLLQSRLHTFPTNHWIPCCQDLQWQCVCLYLLFPVCHQSFSSLTCCSHLTLTCSHLLPLSWSPDIHTSSRTDAPQLDMKCLLRMNVTLKTLYPSNTPFLMLRRNT